MLSASPSFKLATLRNKTKLTAINAENHEEGTRKNQARDENISRIEEKYNAQVTAKIEGKVTKELSREFRRKKSPTLEHRPKHKRHSGSQMKKTRE